GVRLLGRTDTGWQESTLTWNTATAPGGTDLGTRQVNAAAWHEWDITGYLENWEIAGASQPLEFILTTTATSELSFHSKENAVNRPELIIRWLPVESAGGADFETWRVTNFPNSADLANPLVSGPRADPMGDGVPNLMRFALGGNLSDNVRSRVLRIVDGAVEFWADPGLQGIAYVVRGSSDLQSWPDVLWDSRTAGSFERGAISIPLPQVPGGRYFVRLEVIRLDPN
ncbi:MAG: DNRLRE domain-containing protein, partial [Verrucomicrobiia bacterium]